MSRMERCSVNLSGQQSLSAFAIRGWPVGVPQPGHWTGVSLWLSPIGMNRASSKPCPPHFTNAETASSTIPCALEEALEDFAGCAVIISHDRWFLGTASQRTSSPSKARAMSNGSRVISRITKDKMRRLGQDSVIPHRVKYKKLTR